MYKYLTKWTATLAVATAIIGLTATSPAVAGKAYGKPGNLTIVEAALASPEFASLVEAIVCFSPDKNNPLDNNPVIDLLSGPRKFTVFAPNNEAFEDLLGDDDPCADLNLLYSILTYHVTNGRRFDNSVFNANRPKMIRMINGESIMTEVLDVPVITDLAEQEVTLNLDNINIKASNGVIHEINSVLIPIAPEE